MTKNGLFQQELIMQKEAKAGIKINKLLEESGWRFFDDKKGQAKNIEVESNVNLESLGDNFGRPAKDVELFLFTPEDSKKIKMFKEHIRQAEF